MIDKTITKFCWGYCSKSDFFISNSGILQLIQKVQFHLSSLGKDHFMCHWMKRNQLSCCFGHFLKSFTKPFLEETRYRQLHPEIHYVHCMTQKNTPFCMLMLHSNRSSKAEVFSVSGPWGEGLTKIICFLFTLSLKCSTQNFQITTSC